jgi:hypothetical protein
MVTQAKTQGRFEDFKDDWLHSHGEIIVGNPSCLRWLAERKRYRIEETNWRKKTIDGRSDALSICVFYSGIRVNGRLCVSSLGGKAHGSKRSCPRPE